MLSREDRLCDIVTVEEIAVEQQSFFPISLHVHEADFFGTVEEVLHFRISQTMLITNLL